MSHGMSDKNHLASRWNGPALLGTFAALGLAVATPAHAAIFTSPLSISAVSFLESSCIQAARIVPAAPPALAQSEAAKSAAILGGTMSALDRIRMDQAGLQSAPASASAVSAPSGTHIGAGKITCGAFQARQLVTAVPVVGDGIGAPSPVANGLVPQYAVQPPAAGTGRDDFLATSRVAIRRTSFSGNWERVSNARLSQSRVRTLLGAQPYSDPSSLQSINRWVNRSIAHVEDREGYNRSDYWASAGETLSRRSGDCEDFAILKYQMLLALGFDASDMYLTLARDLARNADHAVLIVRQDGKFYMLDNSTDVVLPADMSYDYRPTLSFNSESAWIHGYTARPPRQEYAYLSVSATLSPRVIGLSR